MMTRLENSPNGSLACHFASLTRCEVRGLRKLTGGQPTDNGQFCSALS